MNYTERLYQQTITHTVYESFFSIRSCSGSRLLLHNDVTVNLVIGPSSGGLRKGGGPVQIKWGGPFLYTLL